MSERPSSDPGKLSAEATAGFRPSVQPATVESIDPLIWNRIDAYLASNRGGAEGLIPLLHLAQATLGYLPAPVLEQIAMRLDMPLVQIHGVVSFYPFFKTTPRAKYPLMVCMGTACFVRRARVLSETIRQVLGVDVGSVTKDGLFGLEEVRCLGACGLAPAMLIGGEIRGNLTPPETRKLVFALQARTRRERIVESRGEHDE